VEDVDAAVGAAARAFPKWARRSGHERAKYLYALARLLQKHSRLFAVLESLDNGKPIREAATSTCRWHSGISTTTQASPNFLQKNFPVTPPSASAVRSSRGTSRS
jgi:acyl-CoA reductase-like NAD-dependent aldehyde dehydrogenase